MGIVRKTTTPIITGSATPFTTTNNITQTGSINNSGDQTGKVYGTLNQPEIFVMYTGKDTETAKTTVDNENKKISVDLLNKGYKAGPGIAIEEHHDVGADIISADLKAGDNITIVKDTEKVTISATDTKYTAGNNIQINGTTISATDTTYTAGTNITIDANNKISATSYTAGYGLNLTDYEFSVDTSVVAEQSDISEERQSRQQRDNELSQAIQEEADTRAEYDTALNNRIDSLESRGRFLSTWNAQTGLPSTYPTIPETYTELTYTYTFRAGDYYIIHNVGTTNKKPTGASITANRSAVGQPWTWNIGSATETEAVSDNGTYTYDGTNWVLMGAGTAAAWGAIGGNINDQTDLNNTFVHKSGYVAETITGLKTFSNNVTVPKLLRDSQYSAIGDLMTPFDTIYVDQISSGQTAIDDENSGTTIKVDNLAARDRNIIPTQDNSKDLGSASNRWRDLYLSRNLTDGTNSISVANIANKNEVVDKTTDQTIGGVKTFSSNPLVAGGSRLPSEYQEVEYIESTVGGCWIDTGVTPKQNIGIKVDYDPNSERRVFGVQENNQHILEFYDNRDGSIVYIWNAGGGYGISATTGRKIVFFNYNHDLKVRTSTHTAEGSLDSSMTFTYTKNLYLFNSNGLQSGYEFKGKIYDASITEDAGEIKHFIPCYRKSDNVIGMYDIIGGTFYTNQGTGSFTKGADVGVPVLLATQAWAQEKLPTVTNDRYLHTNASTGALEWSEVAAGSTDRSSFIEGL